MLNKLAFFFALVLVGATGWSKVWAKPLEPNRHTPPYLLFEPEANGEVSTRYVAVPVQKRQVMENRPDFLRHAKDNPIYKLWLEKEMEKHKNDRSLRRTIE